MLFCWCWLVGLVGWLNADLPIMSEHDTAASRKRRPSSNHELLAVEPPTKRASIQHPTPFATASPNTAAATNFLPTSSRTVHGHRFLPLHLQILRTLYQNENDKNGDHDPEEIPLDELWQTIEEYMKKRVQVQALESKVRYYRDLYNETLDFVQEQEEKRRAETICGPFMSVPSTNGGQRFLGQPPLHGGGRSTSHSWVLSSRRPAHMTTPSTSSGRYPSVYMYSSSSPHTSFASPSSYFATPSSRRETNAFGLVAKMFQENYCIALDKLQQITNPFEPLSRQVAQRIQSLEEEQNRIKTTTKTASRVTLVPPIEEKEESLVNDVTMTNPNEVDDEEEEDQYARIETKLLLWKKLQLDLTKKLIV